MEFEPFILGGFEPRVRIGLNPFEPAISIGFEPRVQIGLNPFEPVISNGFLIPYVSHLTGNLTVILCITARTGEPGFACAVTLHEATAIILHKLTPRGGGK
jgi:hypothetical protein